MDERFAYTAIVDDGGYSIGRAEEDVSGYTPMPEFSSFGTYDDAQTKADELNLSLGLEKIEGIKIVLSSMRNTR